MTKENLKIFKWGDFIVIAILLIAIAFSIYFFVKPLGERVEIYYDGNLVKSANLNEDMTFKVNKHISVRIEDGNAYVLSSDCVGQDCIKSGKIQKVGQMIVCLPNKVIIKIVGKGDVDVVSG